MQSAAIEDLRSSHLREKNLLKLLALWVLLFKKTLFTFEIKMELFFMSGQ